MKFIEMVNRKFGGQRSPELSANNSENRWFEDYSLSKLQQLAAGNINFTIEMLEIYLQNADKDISELKTCCTYNDWERAGTLAHKLIPASEYLQLDKLVRYLKDIETNTKRVQDQNTLIQLVNQSCDAYSEIKPMIVRDLHELKRDKLLDSC